MVVRRRRVKKYVSVKGLEVVASHAIVVGFTQREDGSYLVSGWMPVDEFADKIGVPIPRDAKYETVAGYVLAELNHLPSVGESFVREPWRFEVLDLDGRRIDKVLVGRI